jgi:hypothetical protein
LAFSDWLKKKQARVASSDTRTLCVSNLATSVTEKHLRRLFGSYGAVLNAQIPTHPLYRLRLGFGFVEMADGADAAILALNGATFEGRTLTVSDAVNSAKRVEISHADFRELLLEHQRPVREMILTSGDPGCVPLTKISGVPWWPSDRPRPCCNHGHAMSFMAQFRLSDVPTFESYYDSLVSFHYCQECSYDGNMSFGWNCSQGNTNGYDVSIINAIGDKQADGLGTIAEVVIDPHSVAFRNAMDAPGYEDTVHSLNLPSTPGDYPQGTDDFDENIYPGVIHIAKRKVGGWPTWVQYPEPPETTVQERLHFVGQLDWWLCDRATWCAGGYAYLFLISSEDQVLRGELSLQTT